MSTINLNAIADTWGTAMIRASIAGTVAFVIAWATVRVFAMLSPASKSWLWRLAYVKLLAAFLVAGSIGIPILHGEPRQGTTTATTTSSSTSPNTVNSGKQTALPPPAEASQYMQGIAQSGNKSQLSRSQFSSAAAVAKPAALPVWITSISALTWLMFVWIIGVIWCVFRLAGEWCAGEWLRRLSVSAEDLSTATSNMGLELILDSVFGYTCRISLHMQL